MLSADNASFLALFALLVSSGLPAENKDTLIKKFEEILNVFLDYFLSQLKEDGRSYKHLSDPSRKPGDFTYVVDGQRKDPKTGKTNEGTSAINIFFRNHQYDGVTIKDGNYQLYKVQNKLALLFINGEVDNIKLSDIFSGFKSLKMMVSDRLGEIFPESSGFKYEVCNGATPHILGIKTISTSCVSGGGAGSPSKPIKSSTSIYTKPVKSSTPKTSVSIIPLSKRLILEKDVAKYACLPDDVLKTMIEHKLLPTHIANLFCM
jgi:hypothetical protein